MSLAKGKHSLTDGVAILTDAKGQQLTSILFVCLGNICRSPLAQAAMEQAAAHHGLDLQIDSAGTGDWHIGQPPDPRGQAVAMADGIDISGYRGRQISQRDFLEFDIIVAMDHSNYQDLMSIGGDGPAEISLMLDYVPGSEGQAVADPYYGGGEDFAECWAILQQAAGALAQKLASAG